jgi:ribosomal protein S18 acetylase RimI-like enzyme
MRQIAAQHYLQHFVRSPPRAPPPPCLSLLQSPAASAAYSFPACLQPGIERPDASGCRTLARAAPSRQTRAMDDTEFSIRPAEAADAARLSLIGQATFLESFAHVLRGEDIVMHCMHQHSRDDYAARLRSAEGALWLAELRKGAPIGYAALSPPDLPDVEVGPGDVELKRIYVLSRFHGSGVAAQLMDRAVEHAVAAGNSRLLLGVYSRNGRAIRFYQKNGFSLIGTRRFMIGANHYDDVIMAKPLPAANRKHDEALAFGQASRKEG